MITSICFYREMFSHEGGSKSSRITKDSPSGNPAFIKPGAAKY